MFDEQQRKRKRIITIAVLGVLFSFAAGVYAGLRYNVKEQLFGDESVDILEIINLYGNTRSKKVSFDQYWDVWDQVISKHVDQPVDEVDLFYSSIEGLVAGLDDPYSVYFPPQEAKEFAKSLQGEFEGIGAEIGMRDELLTIIAPLPSSPAEGAGLRAGDVIVKIDDEEAFGFSLDEAVSKIRGKKGTVVVLTVVRSKEVTPIEISITRDKIHVPSVLWEMKVDNIGYIRIGHFNGKTLDLFNKAVTEILLESPVGVILDLRSNPGGYLDASVDVASEWIAEGVIVKDRSTGGVEKEHLTGKRHRLVGMKTVVIVDEGTASGSEIVAGALQDHNVATIIGHKTFGKGSVQDFELFPDGSALKLTTAKWFTPLGREIENQGIEPDIVMEDLYKLNEDGQVIDLSDENDLALQKAISLLKE